MRHDEIHLVQGLSDILEKQLELARYHDMAGVDKLLGQSKQLVVKIVAADLLARPEYAEWHNRLTDLYEELQLVLSSRKDAVAGQIKLINKGKKTLVMYKGGI
jgi:hypothetical protein